MALNICGMSEPTFIKVKDLILDMISSTEPDVVMIGGDGVRVRLMKLPYVMAN